MFHFWGKPKRGMMYELEASEYDRVRPLFQAMDHHLAVKAILEGTVESAVYVDDPARPRAALTRSGYRFYLAGAAQEGAFRAALRRFFLEAVCPQARAAGEGMYVLYYAPDRWEAALDEVLGDGQPLKGLRHYYACTQLGHEGQALLPEGYRLRAVDRRLLAETHLAHLDDLREEMCSERASPQAFLEKSFGVCAVRGGEIAGWCLSEYNTGNRCEVGIATLAEHRRRGLATAMAAAFIERAPSQGIAQIGWHCYARNAASIATALKVGFHKVCDYPVYCGDFDEVENPAVQGGVAF